MLSFDRRQQRFIICLSALAGYVDAVGFIGTGGYFLSFMSGNTTRMAVGAEMSWALVLPPLGLILSFLIGVVGGTEIGRRAKKRRAPVILSMVAILLTAAALFHMIDMPVICFALAAIAMGAENTIFASKGEVRIGLTYMTGTLVKLGQHLHDRLLGNGKRGWLPFLILWMSLALGAIAGAFAFSVMDMAALWLAVGAAAILALAARYSNFGA